MVQPNPLQALGLRQLRDIEHTDDARWPMRALGNDPQLRFAPPPHQGAFRVTVAIEAEDGEATPAIYFNTGGGFADALCVPLRRIVDGRWQGECDTPLPCLAWRLDPLDRPGRFACPRCRSSLSGSTRDALCQSGSDAPASACRS
ncbi:MAG: hypothetical protein RLZ81_425 [Pseudomonadota bacterium]|jgi:hypothetical protein